MEDITAVFGDTPDVEDIDLYEVVNFNIFEFSEEGDPSEGFLTNFFCVFGPFDVLCQPNPQKICFCNSGQFDVLQMESS